MNNILFDNILQTIFVFLYGFFAAIGIAEFKYCKDRPNENERNKWFAIAYVTLGAIGLLLAILRPVFC